MRLCSRCGYREVAAKGRCKDCYRYWKQHGTERPMRLIRAQYERTTGRPLPSAPPAADPQQAADEAWKRLIERLAA